MTRITKKSELDIAKDTHFRSSPLVIMNTVRAVACAPQALPPHHEGLGSTRLHMMPFNPHLRADIEAETTSPHPIPRGSYFITAMHPGVLLLLSDKLQLLQWQSPQLQTETRSHLPTAILGNHLTNLKQSLLQKNWTQAAGLRQTVVRKCCKSS